jgi:hypothetical protein
MDVRIAARAVVDPRPAGGAATMTVRGVIDDQRSDEVCDSLALLRE